MIFYYVYVLLCFNKLNSKRKFYIGSCQDLKNRIKEHQFKEVKTTKKFDKIVLVYYESSLSKKDSRKRELQLKSGFGRGYIKRRLTDYLNHLRD